MQRVRCLLPEAIQGLCDTGCVYRERAFKHLACASAPKTAVCVAPCQKPPCLCVPPKTEMKVKKQYVSDLE